MKSKELAGGEFDFINIDNSKKKVEKKKIEEKLKK